MREFLVWLVYAGAVCYGRATWHKGLNPLTRGQYTYHYETLWSLQRELGYPPVGLIRSC